jgi:ribosome maturation factor RimP
MEGLRQQGETDRGSMTERGTSRSRSGPLPALLAAEVESDLASIAAGCGCELLAAEWKGGVLRLIIDRPDGVSIAHCEDVSKQASALLDVHDFAPGHYVLEVSSPGLDRPLYRPSDYERFRGKLVRVTFMDPETERKKTVVGRIADFIGQPVAEARVTLEDERANRHVIALDRIRAARLEIELGRGHEQK